MRALNLRQLSPVRGHLDTVGVVELQESRVTYLRLFQLPGRVVGLKG